MENVAATIHRRKEKNFLITELTLSVPQLPPAFENYRFVMLADFHYGTATPLSYIQTALELAEQQSPQLLLLNGDYLELDSFGLRHLFATKIGFRAAGWRSYRRDVHRYAGEFAEALSGFPAPDGIFATLGNHDYHEGALVLRKALAPYAKVLVNETSYVYKEDKVIQLSAVDDWRLGKPDIKKALSVGVDESINPAFKIFLSHNPDVCLHPDSNMLASADLILSGHTHGGQVRIPCLPPLATRTRQRKHVTGLSTFAPGSHFYVTNGIGYGTIRLRTFCPSEIVVGILRRSDNANHRG